MAAVKRSVPRKKPKITASDVTVGNRTLEAVLMDLAERSARAEERSARAEEEEVSARAEELSARAQADIADLGYKMNMALNTLAAVSRDLQGMFHEMKAQNARTEARLTALENRSA